MSWQSAHEAHAIERVALTFQLAEMVPSKPWASLLKDATTRLVPEGFRVVNEVEIAPPMVAAGGPQRGVAQFMIGPGGVVLGSGAAAGPTGVSFQMVEGAEIREEIGAHQSRFVYATTRYAGWDVFRSRVENIIFPWLNSVLPIVNLQMMKLEYWDRFVFDGPAHDVDYGSLLNSASGHLPKFGFETKGLWHSHVGYFAEPGLSSRRLINLNIDAFDVSRSIGAPLEAPEQLRSVGIYSMVQDDQGHRSLASGSDTVSSLEEMHTILKLLLADVITRQAAERISLNAGNMS